MPVSRVSSSPDLCPCKLVLDGIAFACVRKKRGHLSKHRVEGPIVFRSSVTGLFVTLEHGVEWEERP